MRFRYTTDLSPSAPPPSSAATARIDELEAALRVIEARAADLARVAAAIRSEAAAIRSELEGLCCPVGRDHAHAPSGGCICPVCGMIMPTNLRVEYRLRHFRAVHERCPDCGRLFVGLRAHWAKVHDGGPYSDLEEAMLMQEVSARRLGS